MLYVVCRCSVVWNRTTLNTRLPFCSSLLPILQSVCGAGVNLSSLWAHQRSGTLRTDQRTVAVMGRSLALQRKISVPFVHLSVRLIQFFFPHKVCFEESPFRVKCTNLFSLEKQNNSTENTTTISKHPLLLYKYKSSVWWGPCKWTVTSIKVHISNKSTVLKWIGYIMGAASVKIIT